MGCDSGMVGWGVTLFFPFFFYFQIDATLNSKDLKIETIKSSGCVVSCCGVQWIDM